MDRSNVTAPAATIAPEVAAPLPWQAPRLVRMGTVTTLTAKTDKIGRNDGGSGKKRRT